MADREANLVRLNLQLPAYVNDRTTMNGDALDRLEQVARLAEEEGIYLMIVGLGGYRESLEPAWYEALNEQDRWDVQAMFWRAVAERMAPYASVMSYDLVNEPVVVAGRDRETEWWTGELGGERFIQRINLEGNGRAAVEIAEAWTRKMIAAIRSVDERHLITIGNLSFPSSAFGPEHAGRLLDFASPHIYPNSEGKTIPEAVGEALELTAAFAAGGKPVLVGETYPLTISQAGLEYYVRAAKEHAVGFVSHYFGRTEPEHDRTNLVQSVQLSSLEQWIRLGPMLKRASPDRVPLHRFAGPWDHRYDTDQDAEGFGYEHAESLGELMSFQDGTGTALCEGVDETSGRYSLYAGCMLPEGVEFVRILGWMPPPAPSTSAVFRYRKESGELFTRIRDDAQYEFRGYSYAGELGRFYAP
jgi:hypothetical protein